MEELMLTGDCIIVDWRILLSRRYKALTSAVCPGRNLGWRIDLAEAFAGEMR
jgi:hypothetical protein